MRIVESCRMQADALIDELNEIKKQKDKDNFSQLAMEARSRNKSAMNKMFDTANPVSNDVLESVCYMPVLLQSDLNLHAEYSQLMKFQRFPALCNYE